MDTTTVTESPFFRFAYKPIVPANAPRYAKLFIRTAQLVVPIQKEVKKKAKSA